MKPATIKIRTKKYGGLTLFEAYEILSEGLTDVVSYQTFRNRVSLLNWSPEEAVNVQRKKGKKYDKEPKYLKQSNGVEIRNDCMGKEVLHSPIFY